MIYDLLLIENNNKEEELFDILCLPLRDERSLIYSFGINSLTRLPFQYLSFQHVNNKTKLIVEVSYRLTQGLIHKNSIVLLST